MSTQAEGTAREPMGLEEAKNAIEDAFGAERRRARLDAALAVRLAAEYARGHADRKAQKDD